MEIQQFSTVVHKLQLNIFDIIPAIGTLHLQYILRQVNVSTVPPLQLQAAATNDNTLYTRRLRRQ